MTRKEYDQWVARPQDFLDGEVRPGSLTDYQIRYEADVAREKAQAEIDSAIRRAKAGSYGD